MSVAEPLYRLQTLDARVDSIRQALRGAEQQLGESAELRAARTTANERQRTLHDAELRQRDLELALAQTEAQLGEVDQKLYGGRVTNPKELQGWQRDAGQLRERKGKLEEELLGVMDEVETGHAGRRSSQGELKAVEEAWQVAQVSLREQIERLRAELAQAERDRTTHMATIPPAHLTIYERLRRERGGRAVAPVEQSVCQACRIALPAALVQRARMGVELVYCASCGRLLWAKRS